MCFTERTGKMEIDKFVHLNKLFILYKNLLTEKQSTILEYYFGEDLSLGEISDEMSVSKQEIIDTIKRCEGILFDYESKLELFRKETEEKKKKKKIMSILDEISKDYKLKDDRIDVIRDICKELSE